MQVTGWGSLRNTQIPDIRPPEDGSNTPWRAWRHGGGNDATNVNNEYIEYNANIVDNGKGQNLNNSPSVWFRDDIEIIKLKDLEKKIINDNELELIDTKSWIQTIPNLEDSKFLFYETKSKYYGFLLNFYKKRFMHIDLKAYLGNVNSRSSNINIFIDNDKRVFNDEVHFFDHPYFGLILSINEV